MYIWSKSQQAVIMRRNEHSQVGGFGHPRILDDFGVRPMPYVTQSFISNNLRDYVNVIVIVQYILKTYRVLD